MGLLFGLCRSIISGVSLLLLCCNRFSAIGTFSLRLKERICLSRDRLVVLVCWLSKASWLALCKGGAREECGSTGGGGGREATGNAILGPAVGLLVRLLGSFRASLRILRVFFQSCFASGRILGSESSMSSTIISNTRRVIVSSLWSFSIVALWEPRTV